MILCTTLHCTISWKVPWWYWGPHFTALHLYRFPDGTDDHTSLHFVLTGSLMILCRTLHCTLSWHVPWWYWGPHFTALHLYRFPDGTDDHAPLHFVLTGSLMILWNTFKCTLSWQVPWWYCGPCSTALCRDRLPDDTVDRTPLHFVLTCLLRTTMHHTLFWHVCMIISSSTTKQYNSHICKTNYCLHPACSTAELSVSSNKSTG